MTKPSAFNRQQIRTATLEKKGGLLEELHLPPQVISFIRNNSRNLIIASSCILFLVLAWIFYNHYREVRNDKAAVQLAAVMAETADDKRVEGLKEILAQYGGTDAALWSLLELAHIDYLAGDFEAALEKYQKAKEVVSSKNPLLPLITLSIGQTYEQMGNSEKAIEQYKALTTIPGFAGEGYLGLGREYEKRNELDKAKEIYENYIAILGQENEKGPLAQTRSLIEDRLARLQAAAPPAAAPAPPASQDGK